MVALVGVLGALEGAQQFIHLPVVEKVTGAGGTVAGKSRQRLMNLLL